MDGTREKPPGKTAENWSRKDGIRAGAVSGPWRSTARPGAAPKPDMHPVVAEVLPEEPDAVPRPAAAPVARPEPMRADAGSASRAAASIASLRVWIALGALAALSIIGVALIFRPEAEAPPAVSEVKAPAVAAQTSVINSGAAAETGAAAIIHVRIGPGLPAERQAAIFTALEAAGYPEVEITEMPFSIVRSRIGYFREEDRPRAEALAKALAPMADESGGSIELRDYRNLVANPAPGRLDLWVKG